MIVNTIRMVQYIQAQYVAMYLVLGIGNDLLGDDGVGPYIISHIQSDAWIPIDAGIMPENFIRPVRNYQPDTIVIIDAVDMGLVPGSIRIIPPDKISDCGTGTHQMPLIFTIEQFRSICSDITFIGIQPAQLYPDASLSEPVQRAADALIQMLNSFSDDKPGIFELDVWKEQV